MLYKSRLDGKEVVIEASPDRRYGILLSGGLDSSVLFYMILKAYPDIDIKAFTIDKADGSKIYAQKVVDYINKTFKRRIPDPILVGNPNLTHNVMNVSATIDILQHNKADILFNAVNQHPPELAAGAPRRTTGSDNVNIRTALPFVQLYKTHTIDFMYQFGQEELMNITHSCTEQPQGRCGVCWQCKERSWSFEHLGQKDTGTL